MFQYAIRRNFIGRVGFTASTVCLAALVSGCSQTNPVGESKTETGRRDIVEEYASIQEYEVAKVDRITKELARDCLGQYRLLLKAGMKVSCSR